MNQALNLKVSFSHHEQYPICVFSSDNASVIVDYLKNITSFRKKPILLYDGAILNHFLSFGVQGVVDGSEIIVHTNGFTHHQSESDNILNGSRTDVTPIEYKAYSIYKEFHRMEDVFYMRQDAEKPEADQCCSQYNVIKDILSEQEEECTTDSSSDSDDSVNTDNNDEKPVQMVTLTVLGSKPKEVSTEPLTKIPDNLLSNCPKSFFNQSLNFRSLEEFTNYFLKHSERSRK